MSDSYKLISIELSPRADKKLTAIFRNTRTGRIKKTHFGAASYEDFTIHKDEKRKQLYIQRHSKEEWTDPTKPGTLSRYLLWNKPTLTASLADFKRRFKV